MRARAGLLVCFPPMGRLTAKSLVALGASLLMTACASVAPPQPPSLDLPKPPSDLRATRKGEHVTLAWTAPGATTDRRTIRKVGATQICRGLAAHLTQCGNPVGEAAGQAAVRTSNQKVTGSYVDTLPAQLESDSPGASVSYAVEVLNAAGRGAGLSNEVQVRLARTLAPPRDFAAHVAGEGVVLTWTKDAAETRPTPNLHYVYRIYRRLEGSSQWNPAGEIAAGSGRNLSFTDAGIEWEKTYDYRAETVTVITADDNTEAQIEGDDTREIKVFAHDVFPPAIPSGLQAVASGPGQKPFVDLVWAPVSDIDLDGYNVYRHEEGSAPVKVNTELVRAPAYRDANLTTGKRYFYSVSAVDVRGNESARSEEASETLP